MQTAVQYLAMPENYVYASKPIALVTKHPRKELLEILGHKHADKVYVTDAEGHPVHVGYVISGVWYTLYQVIGRGPR